MASLRSAPRTRAVGERLPLSSEGTAKPLATPTSGQNIYQSLRHKPGTEKKGGVDAPRGSACCSEDGRSHVSGRETSLGAVVRRLFSMQATQMHLHTRAGFGSLGYVHTLVVQTPVPLCDSLLSLTFVFIGNVKGHLRANIWVTSPYPKQPGSRRRLRLV